MDFIKKYKLEGINKQLLNIALTHSSYSNENGGYNYERLEFLGDAVLQLVISDYYYKYTKLDEGKMSKERASYVCERALASYVREMNIISLIRVGEGQKDHISDSIMADVFESIIGIIYLSFGFHKAKYFIDGIIIPHIKKGDNYFDDYKSVLQEMVQTTKNSLEYVVVSESGPSHNKTFKIDVVIDGIVFGRGIGKTKKEAEQNAAYVAYQKRAKR